MRVGLIIGAAMLAAHSIAAAKEPAWASAADLQTARAAADLVVVAYIDSARQPRGARGICPADGYVVHVERGNRMTVGAPVSANVPCAMVPSAGDGDRRVAMRHMWDGTWARLYFSGREMIDYQPLLLAPAD